MEMCGTRALPNTRRIVAALAAACATVAVVPLSAGALAESTRDPAPRSFALVFEGGQEPGVGQENPRRRGSFSAAAPVCSTGVGIDERYVYPYGVLREHTCADGTGSFTALLDPLLAEHGGVGRWKILGGTDRYARLRGQGSFTGEFVGGSPSRQETISFRTTWRGLVGFDDRAPSIGALWLRLTKLPRPNTYRLRVSFRTLDDVETNRVAYRVLPTSGSYALAFAEGRTRSPRVSLALVILPRRSDLPVLVEIRVSDPLGNEHRLLRSVPLPR